MTHANTRPLAAPLALVVVAALAAGGCASLPAGDAQGADEVARAVEAAVNKAAWDAEVGAVRFGFRGTREHVWDRARDLYYVKDGDTEVWMDLWDRTGVVKKAGVDVDDAARAKGLADAWAWFCNDTFWLNPLVKLFDDGATRALVDVDGRRGLKITYGSGGVTPGDSYLWILDDTNKPTAVRMWVSVLPVKGMEFSWEGWVELAGGAKIATTHKAGPADVSIDAPKAAKTLAALEPGPDRFAALVARRAR